MIGKLKFNEHYKSGIVIAMVSSNSNGFYANIVSKLLILVVMTSIHAD